MRRSVSILISLAVLTVAPMAPAMAAGPTPTPATGEQTPAEASGIGIRLLDIPVSTQDDPRARSYIVDSVPPGTTIERRVHVQNATGTRQSVRVYGGAARIDEGSFVGEDGDAENELTSWMSVERPHVDLDDGEGADVLVTVEVPADAAEGERYAAIWAEVRAPEEAGSSIVSASRAGVRMYLSVGPGNGPPAGFEITSLTVQREASGRPQVVGSVTNTGGRAVDLSGSLSLTRGPGGLSAGPFDTDAVTTIAPGGTGQVLVTMAPELPPGPWHAELEVTSGLLLQTATADFTFPDPGDSATVLPDAGPSVPLIVAGIVAVLVVLVLLLWVRHRRAIEAARR